MTKRMRGLGSYYKPPFFFFLSNSTLGDSSRHSALSGAFLMRLFSFPFFFVFDGNSALFCVVTGIGKNNNNRQIPHHLTLENKAVVLLVLGPS